MGYISSNDNRFYVSLETAYGEAAAVVAQNRVSAVKLSTKHRPEKIERKDKTGTRTFLGDPSPLRSTTSFALRTYMTGWSDQSRQPAHGPLFEGCLGSPVMLSNGGTITSANSASVTF